MNSLPKKTKALGRGLMPLCVVIIPLMLCGSGCASPSPISALARANSTVAPPLPDYRVLAEMDAHGMTPANAPHTWEFLGRVFRYYDMTQAMVVE